jgi:hypothetical protein
VSEHDEKEGTPEEKARANRLARLVDEMLRGLGFWDTILGTDRAWRASAR